MNAAQASIFEEFIITSDDGSNSVNLYDGQIRIISFDYFESILSPCITGTVIISSGSDAAVSREDPQNRVGSILSHLPLRAGSIISTKIRTKNGVLNFSGDDYKVLYVTKVVPLIQDSNSETISIKFTSKIGWLNETTRITRSFNGKITKSVESILTKELGIKSNKIFIEEAINSLTFTGMRKRPFDLLIGLLLKQSIPPNTVNPGYFCYETKSGFNYVSIDTLINREEFKIPYEYNGKNISSFETKDDSADFKVATFSTEKDQDLLMQIRSGMYATKNLFFNPLTFKFTEIDISVITNSKFSSLGKKQKLPRILDQDFNEGKKYHRVQSAILDIGSNTEEKTQNNNPELYYAAGTTRYNALFSQIHNVTIPSNILLEAGDSIILNIESISNDKVQGVDQVKSGKYIIRGIRHHFTPKVSTTGLKLIRDSYGLHFSKSK